MVDSLGAFLLNGGPREGGLEHAGRADISITASSLRAMLAGELRNASRRRASSHRRTGLDRNHTIKKYDSGYAWFFAVKMPEPFRSLGSGTRKCA